MVVTDRGVVEAGLAGEVEEALGRKSVSYTHLDVYKRQIKPLVENFGCRCERVDEQEFNGSIRDRILRNIREARFILSLIHIWPARRSGLY